ncbi:MAG: sugar ABC transporter substrate-binding protein [Geminicoccaceae bacterium]
MDLCRIHAQSRQPLSCDLRQGCGEFRRLGRRAVRDARDRGQFGKGHRRCARPSRPHRRQARAQHRSQRQPRCAGHRRGMRQGRRLCRHPVEQARRFAPLDFDPNYVAHMSFDGVPTSKAITEALISSMGGEGGIVAIGGILSNVPAIERKLGLEQAVEASGGKVNILDFQPADWNETKAFEIMQAWLTRFGDEIKGVWAANDGMAIGALEALRQDGRAGAVPVTGIDGIDAAYAAIEAGEMAGTVAWDPNWTGGMGLSIAYNTALGNIDIASEPHEHREFYGTGIIVTADNLADVRGEPAPIDFKDYWGKATGQIQYRG